MLRVVPSVIWTRYAIVGLVAGPAVPPAVAEGEGDSDSTEADSTVPAPGRLADWGGGLASWAGGGGRGAAHAASSSTNDAVPKRQRMVNLSLVMSHGSSNQRSSPQAADETGAPDQCTFLICARARRCQQPSNCLAGVVPLTPRYQPLYKAARERDDAQ